jgi:NADH dehydrogenase (ubiquinone) 1 alpha subcomplex subunit 6
MYSLNLSVSQLRTKIRQEFERHRYVNQVKTVDVLLFHSHQEYQVQIATNAFEELKLISLLQETLNFWKQTSHVLKYFHAEEEPKKLPNNFIHGFLEGRN